MLSKTVRLLCQGRTLDELMRNIRKVIALCLENEPGEVGR